MGIFDNLFQAAGDKGATPPPDRPPQRGSHKRDQHRDNRPAEDKGKAKQHYDKEAGKQEGNGGEQKDGKLW